MNDNTGCNSMQQPDNNSNDDDDNRSYHSSHSVRSFYDDSSNHSGRSVGSSFHRRRRRNNHRSSRRGSVDTGAHFETRPDSMVNLRDLLQNVNDNLTLSDDSDAIANNLEALSDSVHDLYLEAFQKDAAALRAAAAKDLEERTAADPENHRQVSSTISSSASSRTRTPSPIESATTTASSSTKTQSSSTKAKASTKKRPKFSMHEFKPSTKKSTNITAKSFITNRQRDDDDMTVATMYDGVSSLKYGKKYNCNIRLFLLITVCLVLVVVTGGVVALVLVMGNDNTDTTTNANASSQANIIDRKLLRGYTSQERIYEWDEIPPSITENSRSQSASTSSLV